MKKLLWVVLGLATLGLWACKKQEPTATMETMQTSATPSADTEPSTTDTSSADSEG